MLLLTTNVKCKVNLFAGSQQFEEQELVPIQWIGAQEDRWHSAGFRWKGSCACHQEQQKYVKCFFAIC